MPAASADERSGPLEPPRLLLAFGHLAVLSAFALAQPLFNLLADNPEFFAARGSTAAEIITFAVGLVVIPPLALVALEALAGLAGQRVRAVVHLVFVTLLAAVVFIQVVKDALDASDFVLIALALALGAGAAALYSRAEPVRSFMSVLTPAPLLFLVLFLFVGDVSKLTLSGEADAKDLDGVRRVPVVMVVFDELPSTSLMDGEREVDAKRYPGFGRLAADATWYRNAHAIYDSTSRAVPAIMDGELPRKDSLPTSSEHPNSIFALLGKSHVMNVNEEATSVCSRDLCEDARLDEPFLERLGAMTEDLGLVYAHVVAPPGIEGDLASVSETWGEFGGDGGGEAGETGGSEAGEQPNTRENLQGNRNKRFDAWIESIEDTRKPALNFKHALLPHVPWQYLPDGRQYRRTATDPIPQISRQSYNDDGQLQVLQQRHLLQLGFADLEIQKMIERLERLGIYDDALIVVTADHGVAFKRGRFDRRRADEQNIEEIAPVPLFIKAPGQTKGVVDDSVVETIDILPTIAEILEIDLPDEVDGKPATSAAVRGRTTVRMLKRDLSGFIKLSKAELERRKAAVLARRVALFGTGADGPRRLFRIGPAQDLIGANAADFPTVASDASVSLVDSGEYDNVDLRSATVPIWVTGRIGGGPGPPRDLVVAVNGVIRASGSSLRLATGGGEVLSMLVPPSSFRQGRNRVEVFEVAGTAGSRELRRLK